MGVFDILKYYSFLRIKGSDSKDFLNKLTTNNLENEDYNYHLMTCRKGKIIADFFIKKLDESYYLITIHEKLKENFIKIISMYKLRSDVLISDVSDKYIFLYSRNLDSLANLANIDKNITQNIKHLYSKQDPRNNGLSKHNIFEISNANKEDVVTNLEQNAQYQASLYNDDKYNLGIIECWSDMIINKSMPLEYGLDRLNGINFNKGCYIGQEVISRTISQGVIRKRIFKAQTENNIQFKDLLKDLVDQSDNAQSNSKEVSHISWKQLNFTNYIDSQEGQDIDMEIILCSYFKDKAIFIIKDLEMRFDLSYIYVNNIRINFEIANFYNDKR